MKIKFGKSLLIADVLFSGDFDHVAGHLDEPLRSSSENSEHLVVVNLEEQVELVFTRTFRNKGSSHQVLILIELQGKSELSTGER